MTKTQKNLIAAIEAELAAAIVSKEIANDQLDADRFYAACERVNALEGELRVARMPKCKGCAISRELASNNID